MKKTLLACVLFIIVMSVGGCSAEKEKAPSPQEKFNKYMYGVTEVRIVMLGKMELVLSESQQNRVIDMLKQSVVGEHSGHIPDDAPGEIILMKSGKDDARNILIRMDGFSPKEIQPEKGELRIYSEKLRFFIVDLIKKHAEEKNTPEIYFNAGVAVQYLYCDDKSAIELFESCIKDANPESDKKLIKDAKEHIEWIRQNPTRQ